jgi:hypothetical protein
MLDGRRRKVSASAKRLLLPIVEALNWVSVYRLAQVDSYPTSSPRSPPSSPLLPHPPQHERGACMLVQMPISSPVAGITSLVLLKRLTNLYRERKTSISSRGDEHHGTGLGLDDVTWPCSPKNGQHAFYLRCWKDACTAPQVR